MKILAPKNCMFTSLKPSFSSKVFLRIPQNRIFVFWEVPIATMNLFKVVVDQIYKLCCQAKKFKQN